jgi:DNA-binding CsgD family transcriptional regulator/PAS domain-containing protein
MRKSIDVSVLSNLIGSIYDCALDPALWPATLSELHLALDFKNASMQVMALPSGGPLLGIASGVDSPWLEKMPQYGAEVIEQWGGAEKIQSYPLDEPAVLSWVNDRANWADNRYYVEWGEPQGIIDVMAIGLARDAGMIGSIGMGRHASAGEIGDREVEAARLLIPHLQRAVAIGKLLDMKSLMASAFEAALDTLAAAVVLTDADLRIVHGNAAAQAMLAAGDPIRCERGLLGVRSPAAAAALGAAVRHAAKDEARLGRRGFGIPATGADGGPCVLHVLPLRHGALRPGLAPSAAAAVFVAPAVTPALAPAEALAALFDLTAAEARMFAQIAAGRTQAEIATALGIGGSTVKTHLLRLFAKTGAHRQADLVKLAGSLALPV